MKMRWMGPLAAFLLLAGCGSSGAPSMSANASAERSGVAFQLLRTDAALQPCIEGQQAQCSCPGGGTLTANDDGTFTLDSCKTSGGLNYVGTVTPSATGEEVDLSFTVFGECTSVTGTLPAATCGGEFTANCTQTIANCQYVADVNSGGCDVDC